MMNRHSVTEIQGKSQDVSTLKSAASEWVLLCPIVPSREKL